MQTERKKVTPKQIAEIYNVSRTTVQRWMELWMEHKFLLPLNYNPRLRRQPNLEYYLDEVEVALEKMQELESYKLP